MRRGHRPLQQGADRRHDHIPTPITIPTASPRRCGFSAVAGSLLLPRPRRITSSLRQFLVYASIFVPLLLILHSISMPLFLILHFP